jgi:hypothetical protein
MDCRKRHERLTGPAFYYYYYYYYYCDFNHEMAAAEP